jgi:hypothetical protein
MKPYDAPVPDDDAIARAARRTLGALAGTDALGDLSWDAVRAGARRVQRRRLAVVGAACAVVLLGAGAAVATVGRNDDHVNVAGAGSPTTTTTPATSTSTPEPSTTTSMPATPSSAGATTTLPAPPLPAGASAIEGTLTIASSTWVAEQPASFTITVRNTAAQEFRFGSARTLGIVVQGVGSGGCIGVDSPGNVLAPGEQRTYTSELVPRPDMIGPATIYTAVLEATDSSYSNCFSTDGFSGVPTVPVTIVPPGWVEGQPLDPSQGMFAATLAADATMLGIGEATAIHVDVRNAGSQPQRTDGYGSLAVVCYGPGIRDGYPVFIGSTTLDPGATQSFTVAFPVDQTDGAGTFVCSLGMTFHGVPDSGAVNHIDTNYLGIEVQSESGSTTTTAPESTPSTTIP